MGDSRTGGVSWYAPDPRGVLPIDDFYVPTNLGKLVQREAFEVASDRAFEAVMRACADREVTWITEPIVQSYVELHRRGHAHSVECWKDDRLVGGLYGVALGGAFFGESMFHRVTDASKVALVHLVRWLREGGFVLLDIQFVTSHLEQFGAYEVPLAEYLGRLKAALDVDARWPAPVPRA